MRRMRVDQYKSGTKPKVAVQVVRKRHMAHEREGAPVMFGRAHNNRTICITIPGLRDVSRVCRCTIRT